MDLSAIYEISTSYNLYKTIGSTVSPFKYSLKFKVLELNLLIVSIKTYFSHYLAASLVESSLFNKYVATKALASYLHGEHG